jgi:putative flippase GtrA
MLANFNNKITNSTALKKFRAVLSFLFDYIHKKLFWGVFSRIDEKFLKFIFVGLLNTAFSYVLYAFFLMIGLVANMALFFQYIFGVLWNFKTTGSLVFKNNDNRLLLKFVLSYVFTFLLNSVFLNFLIKYINEYLAQAILIFPIALTSFLILKFWVFKK